MVLGGESPVWGAGGLFPREDVLYDQHKSQFLDMASEETQALKPRKFTLNLEKTTRRKHNLSNFRERMDCDKK